MGPTGKREKEEVFCTHVDGNASTLCETLCWEFGTKKTFAAFQAGFQHQLQAPTVFTSCARRESTVGCAIPGNPLENV